MLSKMALGAIWGYQRYLSPHKGFRCAYSVHHGGTGCSGYAKSAIRDHGLWRALPAIRQRLRACRAAYAEIRAQCSCRDENEQEPLKEDERKELERRRRKDKRNCNACDFCAGAGSCAPFGGVTGGARAGASKGCDINPCDGDIGFGGCDCASCDCGGCSCG